ncbi:hypothetical protein Tco_0881673, partial [Tanacetum coccineum]
FEGVTGTTLFQEDTEIQGRTSGDTEILLDQEEPTKLVEDLGSGEKGEKEISTADVPGSTASAIPEDSTAIPERQVYIRRSAEQRKDKGKAIMKEDESVQKKSKKQLEQEQEKAEANLAHVIDWNDPTVLRYHALQNRPYYVAEVRKNICMYLKNQGGFKMSHFKGMSYDDIRPIFERVWDQIQSFVPMDSEKEKGSEKKGSRKKLLVRKRAGEKQSEESTKRQKIEDDIEMEELKAYLDLVPREEFAVEIESLATKADGGSKNYKIFSEMLDDFDRQDVLFQPDEEDEVWKHQHEYNLISWRLFDSCGIHILLMNNGIAIHMMIEKKYPLTQEMLSKMLSRKLEVDHENEMAFELLRRNLRFEGRQVVPVDYFFNNDLEYLREGSSSKKYTTSTTKTKAAKYDIPSIEDMVPSNMVSKHEVYSTKRIIAVTKVKVMKWYDYGYLEEIEVRREDQQIHKFKEGDFPRLHMHDIEYMLLLLVQKKLSNLERDVIFDLGVELQMFTRRIVILKRVEDLQLGVKSYQKKLNITKPETFRSNISKKIPYTAYNNPQGIIYGDKYKRNRLMRMDELYKFSNRTLTSVRTILHDIASNLRMDYLSKRIWSSLDRKRSRIMIKSIDQLLLERRLMRSLEKFIGGRDYGEDLRLLERTI